MAHSRINYSTRYFENPFKDFDEIQNHTYPSKSFLLNYISETFLQCMKNAKPKDKSRYCDGGLYQGSLGLIYTAFQLIKRNHLQNYDPVVKEYIFQCLKANESYFSQVRREREVGFLCDKGGFYIAACIAFRIQNEEEDVKKYAQQYASFSTICESIDFNHGRGSDEIFVGRAGYLCGLLFLKKELNIEPLPIARLNRVLDSMIESGKSYSLKNSSPCPLMYAYHDSEYLGMAHGLAGILLMILNYSEYFEDRPEAEKLVKDSVDYMLSLQKPNGNFPITMEGVVHPESKDLIHWCHGAGGIVYLFAKAYLIWSDKKYLNACIKCGELIWNKGLLRKGPGICHGIGGNGYVHLLLYRLTKEEKYLYRAYKFAEFIQTDSFKREARMPDSPYSLFEGLAGTVCFISDLLEPNEAEFPFLPIF